MNSPGASVSKDLVLIGGGHSHVAVLKRFGMKPIPGLRITLITRDVDTPYSGMLPGYVAGHYTHDDAHIDLQRLGRFAGARVYHSEAVGLDLDDKLVLCSNRPPVAFDVLSINIGSRPFSLSIPGAAELALAVKPVDRFIDGWTQLVAKARASNAPFRVAVVGGGAGGVELSLATQHRLRAELADIGRDAGWLEHDLFTDTDTILPTHNAGVRRRFDRILRSRDIRVHTNLRVERVTRNELVCSDGTAVPCDAALWVTHASAQPWLRETQLALDESGFIEVDDCLQSLSHPGVFAAGDVANVVNHPRPRSGVFAVRQGPPLERNLRRALRGRTPKPFSPQRQFLSLISTGDRYAVASRSFWSAQGAWVWRIKDHIDRRFMHRYADLPDMTTATPRRSAPPLETQGPEHSADHADMRCGGCGSKVGSSVLARIIADLAPVRRDDVLIGLGQPDDAAVTVVPPGKVAVQSVDHFRAFIDDPYVFAKIAANHCLSDLYAMGAEPQSAMAIVTVPHAREDKLERELRELMSGAAEVLRDCGASLVGGHTGEGAETAFGMSVTGLVDPQAVIRKGGMRPRDALILTKPIGTGTLFAADMRYLAKGRWIDSAIESMLVSNQRASECFVRRQTSACTDVTGFGLLGHLVEMAHASNVEVELELDALPTIDGALETVRAGISSSLYPENLRFEEAIRTGNGRTGNGVVHNPRYPLLFDPQTSGGLLASVEADVAEACVAELRALGYEHATVIGRVLGRSNDALPVRLV